MTQEATFGNMVQCHCSSYCGLTSSRFQWQLPEVKRAHMTIEMNANLQHIQAQLSLLTLKPKNDIKRVQKISVERRKQRFRPLKEFHVFTSKESTAFDIYFSNDYY
ncbi:unnamed protein product [Rhizopus microsporus]